jgi:hypothetical protein
MTNIISFGCSHSMGYYDTNDNNNILYAWPKSVYKKCKNVNYFFHIALPGHGVIDYCYLLTMLDKDGILKNTDKIIVQHTSEPRCVFYHHPLILEKFYKNEVRSYFDSDITEPYTMVSTKDFFKKKYDKDDVPFPLNIAGTSILKYILDNNTSKIAEQLDIIISAFAPSSTVTQAVRLSYEKIHKITEKNNIELYEFIWPGMTTDIETMLPKVSGGIKNYSEVSNFNGHADKIANEIITNNIINHLHVCGFFD